MSDLLAKTEEEYGDDYNDHLFEQYKMFVESVEKTSDRRQHANDYFITINTALIALIGLSFQIKIFRERRLDQICPFDNRGLYLCCILVFDTIV
jgi:hypothetical protein